MIRRTLSRLLRLSVVAGAVGGAVKLVRQRRSSNPRAFGSDSGPAPSPDGVSTGDGGATDGAPEQALVDPKMLQDVVDRKGDTAAGEPGTGEPGTDAGTDAAETSLAPAESPPWVEPAGDDCPDTHPVKAKSSSKIYHVPGMGNYDRTTPDRCYRDEAAAEADGYRRAKR